MKSPLEIGKAQSGLYFLYSKCHSSCSSLGIQANGSHNSSLSVISKNLNTATCNSLCNDSSSTSCNSLNGTPGSSCSTTVYPPTSYTCHGNNVDLLWHNRLGHVPFMKMKEIYSIPILFSHKQPFVCSIRPMARQTRSPFPTKTSSSSNKPFDLLHLDL